MGGVFNTVNANLYHYAGNNPVKYTDPDGMEIVLEGTENERNDILNMINRYSKYNYKIDETGHLFRNGFKENYGAYKSEYYSKCLDIGIESEKIINISLNTKHINKDGIVIYSDIDSQSGGGATTSYLDGSPIINVTVSPNIRELHVQANAGEYKLRREYPAEILIHELVGHAIPIAESWNGNAISKENIVREQAKLPLRKPEVNHKCYN